MQNTNELYESKISNHKVKGKTETFHYPSNYLKSSKLLGKNKSPKKLTVAQADKLVEQGKVGDLGSGKLIIEFYDDKEGNRIAKAFGNLCRNPRIKLDVTFKKIDKPCK